MSKRSTVPANSQFSEDITRQIARAFAREQRMYNRQEKRKTDEPDRFHVARAFMDFNFDAELATIAARAFLAGMQAR